MATIKIEIPSEIDLTPKGFDIEDGVPYSGYMRSAPNIPKPTQQPGGQMPKKEVPAKDNKEK